MDAVRKVENEVKETLLLLWADVEDWQQDNHFIHTGYRRVSNSYSKCIGSLAYLHNETVNIYSHLIGALAFVSFGAFAIYVFVVEPRFLHATREDALAFGCFFLSAATCLGMSATFHTISNHSQPVASFGNKLDYIGIVCLIAGSVAPSLYYGLHGHPQLQNIYWTMISGLGIACIAVSTMPTFRTSAYRPFRASMFVGMGLSAVIPVIHGLRLFPVNEFSTRIGLPWILLEAVLYISGAFLYAARIPECLSPGTFDIWGSSHQIFHFLVVAAASSHLKALVDAFDYSHSLRSGL